MSLSLKLKKNSTKATLKLIIMRKFQNSVFKILYIKCPKCPGTSPFVFQSLGLGRLIPEWDCPVPTSTLLTSVLQNV